MPAPLCHDLNVTQCKKRLREIKSRFGLVCGEDRQFVLDYWRASQGVDMVTHLCTNVDACDVLVEPSASGMRVGLYVVKPTGDKVSVVCVGGKLHNRMVTQAFRQAVSNQTTAWRETCKFEPDYTCAKCQADLHDNVVKGHVDHCGPTFAELRNEFLKKEGLKLQDVEYCTDDNRVLHLLDCELNERWTKFHWKRAKLRMLCAACNMRNGLAIFANIRP
jgi:hypothetical protein